MKKCKHEKKIIDKALPPNDKQWLCIECGEKGNIPQKKGKRFNDETVFLFPYDGVVHEVPVDWIRKVEKSFDELTARIEALEEKKGNLCYQCIRKLKCDSCGNQL